MYTPAHFAERRPGELAALMRAHPLATVVVQGEDGLVANLLPLLLDETRQVLRGHVARANPLWRLAGEGLAALVLFHGPQGYVSPSHYPSKAEHGRVVPTWNYAVVEVHGRLRAIDDRAWLGDLVERLTAQHEAASAVPWRPGDAPADYLDRMLAAIVGVELAIERVAGKFKLSQNRDAADRAGVIAGLAGSPLAEMMASLDGA